MDTLFFILSKIVWALIRPDTVLVLVMGLGLILMLRGRVRRAAGALCLALSGFMAIGVFPLGLLVMAPLEQRFPANPDLAGVAGIVVLGGGEETDRAAVWRQPLVNAAGDRFIAAIALAKRFPQAKVLFTGRGARVVPTADGLVTVAAAIFLSAGIAPDRLILEDAARNTAENASLSRAAAGQQSGPWVLVTSAFHMPRAMQSFCGAGWTGLVPWPADFRSGVFRQRVGWNLAANLQDLNDGVKEWVGLLAYRLTGRAGGRCGEAGR